MIKHIIFDCFGTLIDTGNNSIKAVEQILLNVGVHVDAREFYKDWKARKREKMNTSVFLNEKTLFEVSLSETFTQFSFLHIYTSENMQVYKPSIKFYKTILCRSGWLA